MASPLSSERRVSADGSRRDRRGGSFSRTRQSGNPQSGNAAAADRRRRRLAAGSLSGRAIAPGRRRPRGRFGPVEWRGSRRRGGHEGDRPRSPDALETGGCGPTSSSARPTPPAGWMSRATCSSCSNWSSPRTSFAETGRCTAQSDAGAAAPIQHAGRLAGEHPPPLRHRRRLLPPLARREMVYTCGYFPTPGVTLEEAQRAKMDHVCRKLWLRPGETVVEAGCGWGALALYMARHYGVSVKAYNVSREQIKYARRRATRRGARATASSSSKTTTATSRASSTFSSPWACWSTSGPTTTPNSGPSSTAASAPSAAV